MPFNVRKYQTSVESHVRGTVRDILIQSSECYTSAKTALQKAKCVKGIMEVLDQKVDELTRFEIMKSCGRQCIGASTLRQARMLKEKASSIDDLLAELNKNHIGGGNIYRTGQSLHAAYDRCYCGSVNKTRVAFSETYCHCSCGWYEKLFEELFDGPVQVELLGSIIQGNERCEFVIHPISKVHDS